MKLLEARKLARDVEGGNLRVLLRTGEDFDRAREAFSALLHSAPATAALRKEDLRLSNIIMEAAGKVERA